MKLLMYGAGSIGRGFIGPLFSQSGYEAVFVDINSGIIDALNRQGSYSYSVASEPPYQVHVKGVRGVNGMDEPALLKEISECDIMATSLGAAALQKVAPLIAKGFSKRMRENGRPLDILICENLKNSSELLYEWISSSLPDEEKPVFKESCGLIETAIGRMVPVAVPNASDPLHLTVEEYGFLPVDSAAFKGTLPKIEGLVPYAPFSFYEERKLYLHNMGHAICAYLGLRQGCDTIDRAVSDPAVRVLVQGAMTESAAMLAHKYNMDFARIFDHAEDLLLRFGNCALGDTCERVARDPMRKLAADDRLAGALKQCWRRGVYPAYIALGFAVALSHVAVSDENALKIARETGGLSPDQAGLVMELYQALETGTELSEILRRTEQAKRALRGKTV